jgi:hypothetical protein
MTRALRASSQRVRITLSSACCPVDLNDELRFGAKEIDDIRPNRMLAAETETFELFRRSRDHSLISTSVGVSRNLRASGTVTRE